MGLISDPSLIGAVAFLVVFGGMTTLGYFLTVRPGGVVRKSLTRLRELSADAAPPAAAGTAVRGLVRRLAAFLALAGSARPGKREGLRTQCLRAGFFHPHAPAIFLGAKLVLIAVLTVGGAATAFWIGSATGKGSGAPHDALAPRALYLRLACFSLSGCVVGILAPGYWLSAQVRKRQQALRNALPDALDMMVLCLEGGVGVNAAIQRVTDDLQVAHPLLAVEMTIVEREIQLGLSAGEALRKFGDRCGLGDVRDLALILEQSERYGASVTKALRTHVESTRLERQQKAEESAQKAAVKILFPTLLCIFPAIFVVVLGPAAFLMSRLFAR